MVHMKIFESHAFPHLWFLNVGVLGDHQLFVIDSCCCHVSTLCTLVLLVFLIVTAAYVVLEIFEAFCSQLIIKVRLQWLDRQNGSWTQAWCL